MDRAGSPIVRRMGSSMKERYFRAMDATNNACLFVAGALLVIIVLIIPYGVFPPYVLNSGASWPQALPILLVIVVSFFSRAVCYIEYLHNPVRRLTPLLHEPARSFLGWILEALMLATNLFMLVWGIKLCQATWHQAIPEFPIVTVGISYLPIPIGGALTVLFVIERLLTRKFFSEPEPE